MVTSNKINNFEELVQSIGAISKSMQHLARQAEAQYAIEVNEIIESDDYDSHRIERLLDGMLDFCFDDGVLRLYKKLCRYYFKINPEATASYIHAYREMWDEKSLDSKSAKGKSRKSSQPSID